MLLTFTENEINMKKKTRKYFFFKAIIIIKCIMETSPHATHYKEEKIWYET